MNEEIDELKTKLSFIFTYYTNFGEKTNAKNLKSKKFHKMMADSGIKNDVNGISTTTLDLLFFSETKHNSHINLENFLNFLPKLSQEKYPNLSEMKAFKQLMDLNLMPLYQKLMQDSHIGAEKQRMKKEIDEITVKVLEYVAPILFKIYIAYFDWEPQNYMKKEEIVQKSQNSLFSFVKDYEISPPLLTKSTIFQIYNELINIDNKKLTSSIKDTNVIPFLKHDIGTIFTLARFYTFLIRCSYLLYSNYFLDSDKELCNAESFVYFLEMMELSYGFKNLEKKTATTHTSKNSLLIPKKTLYKILHNEEYSASARSNTRYDESLFIHYQNKNSPFKHENIDALKLKEEEKNENLKTYSPQTNSEKKQMIRNNSFSFTENSDFSDSTVKFFNSNKEDLLKIFQFYCSLGEPMNTSKMKSNKFKKMLNDSNILINKTETTEPKEELQIKSPTNLLQLKRYLTVIDSDLMFSKLKGFKRDFYEKKMSYDKKIKSPEFGIKEFYSNSTANDGKLDFMHFIKSIEMICLKLYPEYSLEISLRYLWIHHLSVLLKTLEKNKIDERTVGTNKAEMLTELLQNKDIVEILSLIYKPLMVYYNFYCNNQYLMNFNGFIKFCKDFQVFPDLLTKAKLLRIFYSLALLFSSPQYNQKDMSISYINQQDENIKLKIDSKMKEECVNDMIDSTLFIQGLALCSLEIYFSEPEPNFLEKICFFFELINYSDGRKKVQKELGHTKSPSGASWDVLTNVRKKYPHIFYKAKEKIKVEMKFDDFVRNNLEIIKENKI